MMRDSTKPYSERARRKSREIAIAVLLTLAALAAFMIASFHGHSQAAMSAVVKIEHTTPPIN